MDKSEEIKAILKDMREFEEECFRPRTCEDVFFSVIEPNMRSLFRRIEKILDDNERST
jgi:hypothetical protein